MQHFQPFVQLPPNERGRDFVVGDLHGQMDLLDRALSLVRFSPRRDRLIALGDLVDRGPDSAALLELLTAESWFTSVRGNHDAMMQESARDWRVRMVWDQNDNDWSYELPPGKLEGLADIVDGMPIAIELPLRDGRKVGLIHAEVGIGRRWDDLKDLHAPHVADVVDLRGATDAAAALWGRRRAFAWARAAHNRRCLGVDDATRAATWEALQPVEGVDLVVSGHTILTNRKPVAIANFLFIETGAFEYEGRLTIVDLLDGAYWQVGRRNGRPRVCKSRPTPLPSPLPVSDAWRPSLPGA
ncbi:MAG TPA: metallophosphoesterase [Nevskiaceae bacterium]|nr:metallophosphoesterase [Nevskiaceae bacterium]